MGVVTGGTADAEERETGKVVGILAAVAAAAAAAAALDAAKYSSSARTIAGRKAWRKGRGDTRASAFTTAPRRAAASRCVLTMLKPYKKGGEVVFAASLPPKEPGAGILLPTSVPPFHPTSFPPSFPPSLAINASCSSKVGESRLKKKYVSFSEWLCEPSGNIFSAKPSGLSPGTGRGY